MIFSTTYSNYVIPKLSFLFFALYPNDVIKAGVPPFRTVKLTRIHLEEDAAKITHHANYSLIDYNRAGLGASVVVSMVERSGVEACKAAVHNLLAQRK